MKTILLTLSLFLCFSVSAEKSYYYNLKPVKAKVNKKDYEFNCGLLSGLSTLPGKCKNGVILAISGLSLLKGGSCKIENGIKIYSNVPQGLNQVSGNCIEFDIKEYPEYLRNRFSTL